MIQYRTKEIADLIGIHVNTVRFYEEQGFISIPERAKNGYRIFTNQHIEEFKLARAAFKSELLQNNLRKIALEIVRLSANQEYDRAEELTKCYLNQLKKDKLSAEEALEITNNILKSSDKDRETQITYRRSEVAEILDVTIDTLRNWELNGLIEVKRKENGYRVYRDTDIQRLKIIRSLRHANYSLTAILRMLLMLDTNPKIDIKQVINTPDDNVIKACDKLLVSLEDAKKNALLILNQLNKLREINTTV
ncbi:MULTISPECIES: MerR family transcriptional regulator [Lactobacillales]|uniref:MerR family transcriptional regulator n=1 Tax=Lactobacillales TaxID=186826 RepID=UPI001CBEE691|nr:MerR family transcriptional regulator [Enterococcus faecium]MBZ3655278.1 MerR family transcriptional regulator [Enterococcus faecium]UBL09663.1 Transcriptional regulator MerR family [Enterococcus faecium]